MVLSARELAWRAGTTSIVERVSFDVRAGEFVALMGRNGAGKSTVMDLLAGLRAPHAGAVFLDERALLAWPPRERARRIGHLPQSVATRSSLDVEQIVMMGRYAYADGWTESDGDRRIVDQAMQACGCLPFRGRRLSTLSGGERQRVLLAACLAQDPAVLLLDEPSTFLDIDQQLQAFSMLRTLANEGRAVVAVSHDVNLALTFCTRIIVLAERTVACDLSNAAAADRDDWLALFSPRLRRLPADEGRAWVAYR
jgi:iron complex transport system ATP-binding protein